MSAAAAAPTEDEISHCREIVAQDDKEIKRLARFYLQIDELPFIDGHHAKPTETAIQEYIDKHIKSADIKRLEIIENKLNTKFKDPGLGKDYELKILHAVTDRKNYLSPKGGRPKTSKKRSATRRRRSSKRKSRKMNKRRR